jgi:predicted 2-oxoglutarate/Fe(II)-dependent dioxygenase YbiX
MLTRNIDQLSEEFQRNGAIVAERAEIPLSANQWSELEEILQRMDYAKVVGGDSGDAHSVWVGRFVNDIEMPASLHALSDRVMQIVMCAAMQQFLARLIESQPLCVRRCQANRLSVGDFIGYHIDQDTTPDYKATAIFQFSDNYTGGDFVLHHQHGDQVMAMPKYSMLINRGELPHQVTPVIQGERLTLACFFSTNFGVTQKPRTAIKIAT